MQYNNFQIYFPIVRIFFTLIFLVFELGNNRITTLHVTVASYNHFFQLEDLLSPDKNLGRLSREFTLVIPSKADHSSSSVVDIQSARLLVDWDLSVTVSKSGPSDTGTISFAL